MTNDFPLYLIPLLPLIGAAINLLFGKRLSKDTNHYIAITAVGGAAVIAIHACVSGLWPLWKAGGAGTPALTWQGWEWLHGAAGGGVGETAVSLKAALVLDPLSAVMVLVITLIGFLIHLYSAGYMAEDKRYATYFGYLNLFTGAMLILVLGDSLPVMFVGWEGVGLCSYLLIGFWFDVDKNANAGRKAFVVNRIGDFAFLLGIFLTFYFTKSLSFSGVRDGVGEITGSRIWGAPAQFWICLLFFIGACGKSAQIPLYVWLPDAMAGPTPVSALIHAATMVTAGVYMIARLSFLYVTAPTVMAIVAGVGAATALFAAIIGFAQNDLKKVLAYSTVSQLGLMFVGVGTGNFTGGVFHLMTHAFFKAGLFLGAGSVMHALHHAKDPGDIREMGGLRKKLPITHITFLVYCIAIAGIPPLAGFFSKDGILAGAFGFHAPGVPSFYGHLIWAVSSLASLCTAIYMFRLYFLTFTGKFRGDHHVEEHLHESPAEMTIPLIVLGLGAMAVGFVGIPAFLRSHHEPLFVRWLSNGDAPVQALALHMSSSREWLLMGVATGAGVVGIIVAAALWLGGPRPAVVSLGNGIGPIKKLVANKFYIDELYDLVLVRPFRWLCMAVYQVVDRFIIETLLLGLVTTLVDFSGRALRLLQNGHVQRYMVVTVMGLAAILWFGMRPSDEFTVQPVMGAQNTISLHANAHDYGTPNAPQRKYKWKCATDDPWKAGGPDKTCEYPNAGKYEVQLEVHDDLWGTSNKSSKLIKVGGD